MIVVDSGVWIDYFSGNKTQEVETLDRFLGTKPIGTSEIIYTDVLQGFVTEQDFDIAKKLFSFLTELEMVNPRTAIKSAEHARRLRKIGVSIKNSVELFIATYCIENNYPLLYTSDSYTHFERHLKLQNAMSL